MEGIQVPYENMDGTSLLVMATPTLTSGVMKISFHASIWLLLSLGSLALREERQYTQERDYILIDVHNYIDLTQVFFGLTLLVVLCATGGETAYAG